MASSIPFTARKSAKQRSQLFMITPKKLGTKKPKRWKWYRAHQNQKVASVIVSTLPLASLVSGSTCIKSEVANPATDRIVS
jgi:hypothetical protein